MLRPAHLLLDEGDERLRRVFWRIATDLALWLECEAEKAGLFFPAPLPDASDPAAPEPELAAALRLLDGISREAGQAQAPLLADACAVVWEWAERRDLHETALQFAELAARLDAEDPARCSTAGRLSRRGNEPHRGTMWYRRSARLARMRDDDHAFAIAQLGWSNLEQDLGNLRAAEFHATKAYRAALRVGRKTDAAYAFHALSTILIHQERYAEAWAHARNALASYPVKHPRFPAFAHDVAFLMCRLGHFSSALPVLAQVLPFIERSNERLVVLANLARAAAASGHRVSFERAASRLRQALDEDGEVPATALYHLAEAHRTYELWEDAILLAKAALSAATERSQRLTMQRSAQLLQEIEGRTPGDVDLIPEEGSDTDAVRELLLRKLGKHTVPGCEPGTVPPEKYPIN